LYIHIRKPTPDPNMREIVHSIHHSSPRLLSAAVRKKTQQPGPVPAILAIAWSRYWPMPQVKRCSKSASLPLGCRRSRRHITGTLPLLHFPPHPEHFTQWILFATLGPDSSFITWRQETWRNASSARRISRVLKGGGFPTMQTYG
jgi:hypothetical protein